MQMTHIHEHTVGQQSQEVPRQQAGNEDLAMIHLSERMHKLPSCACRKHPSSRLKKAERIFVWTRQKPQMAFTEKFDDIHRGDGTILFRHKNEIQDLKRNLKHNNCIREPCQML
jgi:hypothetical protein